MAREMQFMFFRIPVGKGCNSIMSDSGRESDRGMNFVFCSRNSLVGVGEGGGRVEGGGLGWSFN